MDRVSPGGEKENVCADGFHQNAVMNKVLAGEGSVEEDAHCAAATRQQEGIVGCVLQDELLGRIGPGLPIELAQRNSAPVDVVVAAGIAVDLDVHHDSVGLLDLPDLAEANILAEAGGEIGTEGISAKVADRHARD